MIDFADIALAGSGLFAAGVVKGATGLGYATCALPFLVLTLGLEPAMVVVVGPAIATCLSLAIAGGHIVETVRRFAPLYIALVPGISAGLLMLSVIDPSIALAMLGGIMICYALLSLVRPEFTLPRSVQDGLQLPIGLANGIITGLTGSQVMPLLPYVLALGLEPARSVQVINVAVMVASVLLGVGLLIAGTMTPPLFVATAAAVAPALAGVEAGIWLRRLLPASTFRSIVLVIIAAMGAVLLWRAALLTAVAPSIKGADIELSRPQWRYWAPALTGADLERVTPQWRRAN